MVAGMVQGSPSAIFLLVLCSDPAVRRGRPRLRLCRWRRRRFAKLKPCFVLHVHDRLILGVELRELFVAVDMFRQHSHKFDLAFERADSIYAGCKNKPRILGRKKEPASGDDRA